MSNLFIYYLYAECYYLKVAFKKSDAKQYLKQTQQETPDITSLTN